MQTTKLNHDLIAARAKGDITASEFARARELVQQMGPSENSSNSIPQNKKQEITPFMILKAIGSLIIIAWLFGAFS